MTRGSMRSCGFALVLFVLCGMLGVTQADVIISWMPNPAVDSVMSYSVFRSLDLGNTVETYWWGITDTLYIDTTLSDDVYYTYYVKAYNRYGSSPPSNPVGVFQSTSGTSELTGTLRLLAEFKQDSLEIRWSVDNAVRSLLQYAVVDGAFTRAVAVPGPGPYAVMIPVTDTVRVCAWSGDTGELLSVYAPIAIAPPEAPEVKIDPFRR